MCTAQPHLQGGNHEMELQSPVPQGEDPAESFPGGFLGMQDSNTPPADVRGPAV